MSKLRYWAGSWLMGAGVVVLVAVMFAAAELWFTDINPTALNFAIPATGSLAVVWALNRRHKQHQEALERRKKADSQHPADMSSTSGRGNG